MLSIRISVHTTKPRRNAVWCVACAVLAALGCGESYTLAEAKGKVVCGGKPVAVGSLVFTPIGDADGDKPGKPATAAVGPDGNFVLSTYDARDGAIVGKHRVLYSPPEGEEEEEAEVEEGSAEERQRNAERARQRRAMLASACVQSGEVMVEVTEDGPNDFTIELVPASEATSDD